LRTEFTHHLEQEWGLDAETILDAIARSSDLTQRGIRGVIADSVFIREVLPAVLDGISGWRVTANITGGDLSYDAVVEHAQTGRRVRIQVKNHRRQAGVPKVLRGSWVVEVQRTRSGRKNGKATRPYRFADFDLNAVCMYPSTQNWRCFTYALASGLRPRDEDRRLIEPMELIPKNLRDARWSQDLATLLGELANQPNNQAERRKTPGSRGRG